MREEIELPGTIGKKIAFWIEGHIYKQAFDEGQRYLSIGILSAALLFLFLGFNLPEPNYQQFCAEHTAYATASTQFSSPADVFKYSLCRADDEISQKAVQYVLHPIFFAARAFFFFLFGIMMMHFLKKDRTMIMDGVLYAIAFFYWALALVIYVSTYSGWF